MGLAHSPRTVTDGLVLALDAGNTKSYSGSGTTWSDLSGKGNDGTLVNSPTYSNLNGGNFNFDEVNDYVNIGSTAINGTAYTKIAWIRPESACRNIISSSGSDGHVMWMNTTDHTVYAGHNTFWGTSTARVSHRPNNPGNMFLSSWRNKESKSRKSVVRLKALDTGTTKISDMVLGEIEVQNSEIDDMVREVINEWSFKAHTKMLPLCRCPSAAIP